MQWNGSAENKIVPFLEPILGTKHLGALGRNVGEVLGVFGDVNTDKQEFPLRGYASSVNLPNLIEIEETLRGLWSPQWPEDQFGKPDPTLVKAGQALYETRCVNCHAIMSRTDPNRTVTAIMSDEGTDQTMARNVATRTAQTGNLEGRRLLSPPFRKLQSTEAVATLLEHVAQRVVFGTRLVDADTDAPLEYVFKADIGNGPSKLSVGLADLKMKAHILISGGLKSFLHHGSANRDEPAPGAAPSEKPKVTLSANDSPDAATSFNVESKPGAAEPVKLLYKARPLNGIWATAPYLHNGSVPTLDELLKPAADRMTSFKIGSLEFDPVHVRFVNEGAFTFDTKAHGNSNAGHEYGTKKFTAEERAQLIAYLKTL